MKSRLALLALLVAGLTATGALAGRIVAPAWAEMRGREPALRLSSTMAGAGQGVLLAVLGGFRALVADGVWLKLHLSWEQRNLPATDSLVRLVPAIDPRPVYFWLNGARIVAYDFTAWRVQAAGGYDALTSAQQEQISHEQARRAIAHLAAARQFHPAEPDLWIEQASIELNRLHDTAAAATSYRKAWELPHAPYYAARLHAEMLRRLGRNAEALAWLIQLHPQLPPTDDAAAADLVLERIRDLERKLGVPPTQAYRPRF